MSSQKNNISIVWDFDGTLTPQDSTTDLIKRLTDTDMNEFWDLVKEISKVKFKTKADSISTSETPAWMHILSEIANELKIPLDAESDSAYMEAFAKNIKLYPKALGFLEKIKNLSQEPIFKKNRIEIHHFIITAGLQDLVSSVFQNKIITQVFGCKYNTYQTKDGLIKNIPIYCMDKTTKTRALFEISKGCFLSSKDIGVDDIIEYKNEWCHFEDMIYIGDGDTDIPAFSLVKARKGISIGVYNPKIEPAKRKIKNEKMKNGKRLDLLTPADFSTSGKLYKSIQTRCRQIADRYDVQKQ